MFWMISTFILFGYAIYCKSVNTKLLDYIEEQRYLLELCDYYLDLYENKIDSQYEVEKTLRAKLNGSN